MTVATTRPIGDDGLVYLHNVVISRKSPIRRDAERLIALADDLGEKHLYYPEVKSNYMQEVTAFANNIVDEVESNAKPYEQGRDELKEEEESLLEQAIDIGLRGLTILLGAPQFSSGFALCAGSGGLACVVGVPLMLHGANSVEEGFMGQDHVGFARQGYHYLAESLGYTNEEGDIAYYTVDVTSSMYGVFKLSLKPNAWKLFRYLKNDFERGFTQMTKISLGFEIVGDIIAVSNIYKSLNIISNKNEATIVVPNQPSDIKGVSDLINYPNCQYIKEVTNGEITGYYNCTVNQENILPNSTIDGNSTEIDTIVVTPEDNK